MWTLKLVLVIFLTGTLIQNCTTTVPKKKIRKLIVTRPTIATPDKINSTWLRNGTHDVTKKIEMTSNGKFVAKKEYIIAGTVSYRGQLPFLVGMDIDGDFFCGGSLITPRHVLTAGHCTKDSKLFELYIGAQDLAVQESGRITMKSTKYAQHSKFNPESLINDIAIVYLPQAVQRNSYIELIRLPTAATVSNSFLGARATVGGWGRTSDKNKEVSDIMYNIQTTVIPVAACMQIYGSESVFRTNICCSTENNQATCQGDSGGPLLIRDSLGKWMQIGIVSYGASSSCEMGYPDVYTRVPSYLSWIKNAVAVPFEQKQGIKRNEASRNVNRKNRHKLSIQLKKSLTQ